MNWPYDNATWKYMQHSGTATEDEDVFKAKASFWHLWALLRKYPFLDEGTPVLKPAMDELIDLVHTLQGE